MSGTVVLDDRNPAVSNVDVTIDVASLDTRQDRDARLRSADFFDDVPDLTFKSAHVARDGEDLLIDDPTSHSGMPSFTAPLTSRRRRAKP